MHEDENPPTQPESETQVFILRLWCESRELPEAEPYWRGMIEHVGSGQRRFLQEPQQLWTFVAAITGQAVKLAAPRSRLGRLIQCLRDSRD